MVLVVRSTLFCGLHSRCVICFCAVDEITTFRPIRSERPQHTEDTAQVSISNIFPTYPSSFSCLGLDVTALPQSAVPSTLRVTTNYSTLNHLSHSVTRSSLTQSTHAQTHKLAPEPLIRAPIRPFHIIPTSATTARAIHTNPASDSITTRSQHSSQTPTPPPNSPFPAK